MCEDRITQLLRKHAAPPVPPRPTRLIALSLDLSERAIQPVAEPPEPSPYDKFGGIPARSTHAQL